ncbi:MAG: hypothetical protein WBA23_00430 [Tunicatimonas sp.]|uniref:hypothetical protein n=1 Tax=Tunicatimonas sp. TaxID=1940096 RepID=UPI003C78EC76
MYNILIYTLLIFLQDSGNATDDGVAYSPQEGFGGPLLWIAAAAVLAVVAFVVIKVFKSIQRSRNLERIAEDANASEDKTL